MATAIGAHGVPAFDIAAGCAGFGYALGVAADMIRGGSAGRILVVGSEKLSDAIDMTDRSNAFIFADGAAAVVVGPTPEQGIGPRFPAVTARSPAPSCRPQLDRLHREPLRAKAFLRMEGQTVFRWAAFQMVDVGREPWKQPGWPSRTSPPSHTAPGQRPHQRAVDQGAGLKPGNSAARLI